MQTCIKTFIITVTTVCHGLTYIHVIALHCIPEYEHHQLYTFAPSGFRVREQPLFKQEFQLLL